MAKGWLCMVGAPLELLRALSSSLGELLFGSRRGVLSGPFVWTSLRNSGTLCVGYEKRGPRPGCVAMSLFLFVLG
jgi:hypothetical protein